MSVGLWRIPADDMRRLPALKAEEARRQAAGERVGIVYREADDTLVIVPRQREVVAS